MSNPIPYQFCKTHPNVKVSSNLRCWRCKRDLKIKKKLQKDNKQKPQPLTPTEDLRLSSTIEKKSNFINCKGGYMNVGKYKGVDLDRVPIYYLKWLILNMELNKTEQNLINRILNK
jgi:hypothetical protein